MDNAQGWKRLAAAVRQRRDDRGWTQLDLATRGGPSIDRIQAIEGARTDNYSSRTLAKLERALEWEQGSVRAILAGAEPSPADAERPTDAPAAEDDDVLTADERRMLEEIRRDPAKRERLLRAILAGHGHEPPSTNHGDDESAGHRAS